MGVRALPDGLAFESKESRLSFINGELELIPAADQYVRFSAGENRVLKSYGKPPIQVVSGNTEWVTNGAFIGGSASYIFLQEEREQKLYVARSWSGDELFQLPYFYGEQYFASQAIAIGNQDLWTIYDLAGFKAKEVTCSGLSSRPGRAYFTDTQFFFREGKEPRYQIYDVGRRDLVSSVSVVGGLFGTLALPCGSVLLIDAEGVKRLDQAGSINAALQTIHRFSTPLDIDENDVVVWHDTKYAYVASSVDRNNQLLLAISLAGSDPVQELRWSETWAITDQGGCISGYNYLTLERKDLLADNAVMLWKPGEPLTEKLLHQELSPVVEVSQVSSPTKGKHGYCIAIQDALPNRAVRSAVNELGCLLGVCCSGVYNRAEEILDRRFDGKFYIEITTPVGPNDFEREFLFEYIKYFRYYGGLSPAGSKASLADPIITWNTPAS